MYILLRGQVTIFIQYATKTEDTDERPPKPKPEPTAPDQAAPTAPAPASAKEESELIRKRLGTYVCSLGKWDVRFNGYSKVVNFPADRYVEIHCYKILMNWK